MDPIICSFLYYRTIIREIYALSFLFGKYLTVNFIIKKKLSNTKIYFPHLIKIDYFTS